MNEEQIQELLYQPLETEMGGIEMFRTAVQCAVNAELKEEWQEYLEQTEKQRPDPEGRLRGDRLATAVVRPKTRIDSTTIGQT